MTDEKPGQSADFSLANILMVAFAALVAEQILHEAVHGFTALLVGARWEALNFFASYSSWPGGSDPGFWQTSAIPGAAALVNILCAFVCILLFESFRMNSRPFLRLFVFFFGAYSLFSGFGYLFFDPLFAGSQSIGDWARVVMMLGGGWEIRIPITLVGAAGTIYGYFWMGKAAQQFIAADTPRPEFLRAGRRLCLWPYIIINLVFSVLAIWHPVGLAGIVASLLKLWFGFIGFFWAFMIRFVWMKPAGPFEVITPVPAALNTQWAVTTALILVAVCIIFLPGIQF